MDILNDINGRFWDAKIWLPEHLPWDAFSGTEGKKFGQPRDFVAVIPLAIVVFCVRMITERAIAMRIGIRLNLPYSESPMKKTKQKRLSSSRKNFDSQAYRQQNGNGPMGPTEAKYVQRTSILVKFSETFWRFTFYLVMFLYGIFTLHDEDCIWNRASCWRNFPVGHHLTSKIHWYYMVEMAFYVSTTTTQFCDVRRKDFWEMFIHHIVTIMLMFGSYSMNYTKIGSVIIIVHDSADFYLEFAKMGKYAKSIRVTNVGFSLFTVAFFLSRLVILPFWVIPTIWANALTQYDLYSVINILFCALLVLQVLHLYWFTHILRALYSTVMHGEIKRDTRSDSEDSGESDGENKSRVKKSAVIRKRVKRTKS